MVYRIRKIDHDISPIFPPFFGISKATDLVGIQIYRSLLHWGRGRDRCDRDRPVAATAVRQPLAPLDPEPLWDPRLGNCRFYGDFMG